MEQQPTEKVPLRVMIRRDWKNPPNIVTAIRLFGSFALPLLILGVTPKAQWMGFALFIILAASDYLDGWMAKSVFGSTDLGKMLDAIVDKVLIFITLLALLLRAFSVGDSTMAAALIGVTALIATREIIVARVKVVAHRELNRIESAIQSGRIAMVVESIALAVQLIPDMSPMVRTVKLFLLGFAVGMSLLSGWDYYRKYRPLP